MRLPERVISVEIIPGTPAGTDPEASAPVILGETKVINPMIDLPGRGSIGQSDRQLHVSFSASKSITPEPNRASVAIYNLSEESRNFIAQWSPRFSALSAPFDFLQNRTRAPASDAGNIGAAGTIVIRAGYGSHAGEVFRGAITYAKSERQGEDFVTRIEAGDSVYALSQAFANKAFSTNTPALVLLEYLIETMGLTAGTPLTAANPLLPDALKLATSIAPAMIGSCVGLMNRFARGLGFGWFVDGGEFFIVPASGVLPGTPAKVSQEGGLITAPEPNDHNSIDLTSRLDPGIKIAHGLEVQAKRHSGIYRVDRVVHAGDNFGGPFSSFSELANLDALQALV